MQPLATRPGRPAARVAIAHLPPRIRAAPARPCLEPARNHPIDSCRPIRRREAEAPRDSDRQDDRSGKPSHQHEPRPQDRTAVTQIAWEDSCAANVGQPHPASVAMRTAALSAPDGFPPRSSSAWRSSLASCPAHASTHPGTPCRKRLWMCSPHRLAGSRRCVRPTRCSRSECSRGCRGSACSAGVGGCAPQRRESVEVPLCLVYVGAIASSRPIRVIGRFC
jgi:hypothetical protein